jgi:hypothetical protein
VLALAITKFQEKSSIAQTGEATEGLLSRLRGLDDLKPWGSIVYDPDGDKWGISWDHPSRRSAVADARSRCGTSKCLIELSFYGNRCGAFAISDKSWSLVARNSVGSITSAFIVSSGRIIGDGVSSGSVTPNGAAYASGTTKEGLTYTSSGRLSGRSGSGTVRRSDGCTRRWSATKQ